MFAEHLDALLIDFYGTITGGDREVVARTCEHVVSSLGLDVAASDFAIRWGELFFAALGRCNGDEFRTLLEVEELSLQEMFDECGVDADPAPFVAELEAYWPNPMLQPDAAEFLRILDVPICCVSNADTVPLLTAIEKHGLHFDAVVSSEDARCYKPASGIFKQALKVMDVSPARVAHIGDSLHSDVAGALRVGITPIWIRRESRIHDIGRLEHCRPRWTISALPECASFSWRD